MEAAWIILTGDSEMEQSIHSDDAGEAQEEEEKIDDIGTMGKESPQNVTESEADKDILGNTCTCVS